MMSNLKGDEAAASSNMQGMFPMPEDGHVEEPDGSNELPGFAARMPGRGQKRNALRDVLSSYWIVIVLQPRRH